MPLLESLERRSKPRDPIFTQVRRARKSVMKAFSLSKVFVEIRRLPLTDAVYVKYAKLQSDRLIHRMLDALVDHHLQRMVIKATRGYDRSVEELATDEEMKRFVAHLVGRKATLVGLATLERFSMFLREEALEHRYGSDALATYIVRRFNEQRPLTQNVVAVVDEFHDVVVMFFKTQQSDAYED